MGGAPEPDLGLETVCVKVRDIPWDKPAAKMFRGDFRSRIGGRVGRRAWPGSPLVRTRPGVEGTVGATGLRKTVSAGFLLSRDAGRGEEKIKGTL